MKKFLFICLSAVCIAFADPDFNDDCFVDLSDFAVFSVDWLNEDQLRFILQEGKKRQIRRMCELVGLKVTGLKRVRIGNIRLGKLPEGQWRFLEDDESRLIRFKRAGKTCMWDLKVVYDEDDSSAVWNDIDLCRTHKITIRYNRKTDTTSATFD
jgi:hypothetical protein